MAVALLAAACRGDGAPRSEQAVPPPSQSTTAGAAGIHAAPASVNAGRLPLDTPFHQEYRLHNAGGGPVTLGRAQVEVVEGC